MELYDELAAFYEDLNMYNDKISEAATEFNNTYASNNYHTRQKNAANVNRLMGDLQETYDRLLSVKVPVSSINADTYSAMETCYYDCTKRISVISEAWDISLMYEEPKYFKDEILEPISRDNDGSTNRYYAEFKSTFPDAKPVKPTA